MKFLRPVDGHHHICAHFMEWDERWPNIVDPATSLWIPKGSQPGRKGQHHGVDFDAPAGTLVSAVADGIIVKARYESAIRQDEGAGLHILQIVQMPGFDAWWFKYSHLQKIHVTVGQSIRRGQPIGETGKSGDAKRDVLHVDLMDTKHQWHPIQWA